MCTKPLLSCVVEASTHFAIVRVTTLLPEALKSFCILHKASLFFFFFFTTDDTDISSKTQEVMLNLHYFF